MPARQKSKLWQKTIASNNDVDGSDIRQPDRDWVRKYQNTSAPAGIAIMQNWLAY
jgi:hypothetical protein